jgi:DNA (cytosine-5)-methyltransferase 1
MKNTIKQADSRLMVQQYTVRANRGKPRIWIEGKRLEHAGLSVGDQFDTLRAVGQLVINKRANGARKVSGKGERPIIDLSGASCAPFSTGDAVAIEYHPNGVIVIRSEGAQ